VKVAFIGSHGTGKTTLCFQLAAHLKRLDRHVDLVKEVARRAPLPLNRETTLDAQRWILHTQIADEIAAATHHEVVVCDRAVLDNYAYLTHRCGRQPGLEPLVREWMRTYDALFLVPIVRRPGFDGVRDTSPEFQLEIDDTVRELVAEFALDAYALSAHEPDGWLKEILAVLELPETPPQISLFTEDT
jgi:nicotinamide riboside kinase